MLDARASGRGGPRWRQVGLGSGRLPRSAGPRASSSAPPTSGRRGRRDRPPPVRRRRGARRTPAARSRGVHGHPGAASAPAVRRATSAAAAAAHLRQGLAAADRVSGRRRGADRQRATGGGRRGRCRPRGPERVRGDPHALAHPGRTRGRGALESGPARNARLVVGDARRAGDLAGLAAPARLRRRAVRGDAREHRRERHASSPSAAGVEILGSWTESPLPSVPVGFLPALLVTGLYTLVPAGRLRERGKLVVAGLLAVTALSRFYLAQEGPFDVLFAVVVGVAIPLAAFRLFVPNETFPVNYRRGRTAHLDVTGARHDAIAQALEEQLGVIPVAIKPFNLEGSGGSTPLRITVKGDPETYLFAKLYSATRLRSDRWYKLGRTLLYGQLEDEKAFNTVRRLVHSTRTTC